MEGNTPGKRLAPGGSNRKKVVLVTALVLVAVLLGSYLGVCAYASGDVLLPGTVIAGVNVGGKSSAQAAELLNAQTGALYNGLEIPLVAGDVAVPVSADLAKVSLDVDSAIAAAKEAKGGFLLSGGRFLAGVFGKTAQITCPVRVGDSAYLDQVIQQVEQSFAHPMKNPQWRLEEKENSAVLVITTGVAGTRIADRDKLLEQITNAFAARDTTPIPVDSVADEPQPLDLDAVAAQVAQEPANATVDPSSDQIIPHKLGRRLDVDKARRRLEQAEEGEVCALSLDVTEPEVTAQALTSLLYRDILGEGSSKITGDANRVGNVKLAAAALDGVVILPGEQMSYNQTTGKRTYEKGYRVASGYTATGVVDMIGGGVCQPSSTLYLACLNADLEIVDRKNHMYTVSYMPDGMDATVSWPNLDYVFANNTPYPIKISSKVENRALIVRIYGTKTDDRHIEMESKVLEVRPASVIYKADASVPQGTTRVVQPAHNGKTVEVYKKIYDGQGNLLDTVLISTDTYRTASKIVAYNPADGIPGTADPPAASEDPETPSSEPPTDPEPPSPGVSEPPEPPSPGTPEAPVDPVPPPPAPPAQEPSGEAPAAQEPPPVPNGPEGLPLE